MKHKRSSYIKMLALGLSSMLLFSFPAQAEPDSKKPEQKAETVDAGRDLTVKKRLHMVAENDTFRFDYDEEGADVYITDKRSGKIWSNTVDENYYTAELANRNVLSQLMTVTFASGEGKNTMVNIFDNGAKAGNFKLSHTYVGEEGRHLFLIYL